MQSRSVGAGLPPWALVVIFALITAVVFAVVLYMNLFSGFFPKPTHSILGTLAHLPLNGGGAR